MPDAPLAYRFGVHTLDLARAVVIGPRGALPLRRQALVVLRVLLDAAPALVTHDDLLDRVWRRRAVSRSALPQAIRAIRRVLGDAGALRSVVGIGYRIDAPVVRIEQAVEAAWNATSGARGGSWRCEHFADLPVAANDPAMPARRRLAD